MESVNQNPSKDPHPDRLFPAQVYNEAKNNGATAEEALELVKGNRLLNRVQMLGYQIPQLHEVSYNSVLNKMEDHDKNEMERLQWPYASFKKLSKYPLMTPSDYTAVALETLREKQYPSSAITYFERVTAPILIAMHSDRQKQEQSGYGSAIDHFVYNLTIGKSKPDTTIMEQTENAVSFVENRPKITAQIQELLSGWLEAKYNGLINSNIEAIVAFGSIPRGDGMYLSDLDLLLLSDMHVSNEDVAQFRDEITKQLEEIMPYARLDILRGKAFSITNGKSELKEFDSELKINYNAVIFAPPDQREAIETIITSVDSMNSESY